MKRKILLSVLALLVLGMLSFISAASGAPASDYWIDLTEDKSVTHVTGYIEIGGTGGTLAGYSSGKTVYSKDAAARYSEPNAADVKAKVEDCTKEVTKLVNQVRSIGKGSVEITTSEPETLKSWDNRAYPSAAFTGPVTGNSGTVICYCFSYEQGTKTCYGAVTDTANKETVSKEFSLCYVDDDFRDKISDATACHLAFGEYGKESAIRVEAKGEINDFDITVTGSAYGTATASLKSALGGTVVTLKAIPKAGYELDKWKVLSGNVKIKDNKFTVGFSDVAIAAVFKPKINEYKIKIYPKGLKLKTTKNRITVSWNKLTPIDLKKLKTIRKYLRFEVQISTDKNFTKILASKTLKYTKSTHVFKNLKRGRKYYVRIRLYAQKGNARYISKWVKKSIKVKKK